MTCRLTGALAAFVLAFPLVAFPMAAQSQTPLPAEVEQAVAAAEARAEPDQRWAFTRHIRTPETTLTARFDPSLPDGEQWTLIEPATEDALNDEQEDLLEALQDEPVSDRLLMIEAPAENYGLRLYIAEDLTPREETGEGRVFAFTARDDVGLTFPPAGQSMPDEVEGRLVVAGGVPARLRLYAPEPFRTGGVARIDALDIGWRLGEVEPGGPIAILDSATRIEGRALFRDFSTDTMVANSDFTRVAAPAP